MEDQFKRILAEVVRHSSGNFKVINLVEKETPGIWETEVEIRLELGDDAFSSVDCTLYLHRRKRPIPTSRPAPLPPSGVL